MFLIQRVAGCLMSGHLALPKRPLVPAIISIDLIVDLSNDFE